MEKSAEEIVRYVFNTSMYDREVLRVGLSHHGMTLVSSIFEYAKQTAIPSNGLHFGRIADDILTYYEVDSENLRHVDQQLAELEQVLPRESLETILQEEERSVDRTLKEEIKKIREQIQRLS